jgi:hypothetical protein
MNESLTNAFLTRSPVQFKQLQDQTAEMIKTADANIGAEQATIQKTTDDIAKVDQQVNEMRFSSASKKDIRTFQFVADQFGTTLDKVAKWFIFTIIFVFDPLAIALILAYNVVTYKKPDELTKAEFPKEVPFEVPTVDPPQSTNFSESEPVKTPDVGVPSVRGPTPEPRPTWLQ